MSKSLKLFAIVGLASFAVITGCARKQRPTKPKTGQNVTDGSGAKSDVVNNDATDGQGKTDPNGGQPAAPNVTPAAPGAIQLTGVIAEDLKKLDAKVKLAEDAGILISVEEDAPKGEFVVTYDEDSLLKQVQLIRAGNPAITVEAAQKELQVSIQNIKDVADAIVVQYDNETAKKDKTDAQVKEIARGVALAKAHSAAAQETIEKVLPELK